MEKSSSISNFRNIPAGVAGVIVLFILAESIFRVLWNPNFVGERIYSRFEPNYRYGYDEHTPIFLNTGSALVCLPTQYAQFHKQYLLKTKLKNEVRIFTLGGSVSRGDKVSNYSNYLEDALNKSAPQHVWRVINLSADGYGSSRMLLLMKKALAYEPDIFILHVHGSNEYEDERDFKYQQEINSEINRMVFASQFLVLSRKVFNYLTSTTKPESDDESEIKASSIPSNILRWNANIEKNLEAMIRIAKDKGIGLVLIARAERNDGAEGYCDEETIEINRIIKEAQESYFFSLFVDTPTVMQSYYPLRNGKNVLFTDNTHWADEGHKLIAAKLAPDVVELVESKPLFSSSQKSEK